MIKAGRIANSVQLLSEYLFIYQTPPIFILLEEEYVIWKFFYCKTLSLFILLIHLYYEFYFFYFGFYILQAHEKELEWKQMTLEPRWSNEVSTVGSAMLDFCTLVSNLWTELHHTVNVGTSARHQVVVSELQDSVSIEIPLLKHNLLIFCLSKYNTQCFPLTSL